MNEDKVRSEAVNAPFLSLFLVYCNFNIVLL